MLSGLLARMIDPRPAIGPASAGELHDLLAAVRDHVDPDRSAAHMLGETFRRICGDFEVSIEADEPAPRLVVQVAPKPVGVGLACGRSEVDKITAKVVHRLGQAIDAHHAQSGTEPVAGVKDIAADQRAHTEDEKRGHRANTSLAAWQLEAVIGWRASIHCHAAIGMRSHRGRHRG